MPYVGETAVLIPKTLFSWCTYTAQHVFSKCMRPDNINTNLMHNSIGSKFQTIEPWIPTCLLPGWRTKNGKMGKCHNLYFKSFSKDVGKTNTWAKLSLISFPAAGESNSETEVAPQKERWPQRGPSAGGTGKACGHLSWNFTEWTEAYQIIQVRKSISSRASLLHNFSEKTNITEYNRPHNRFYRW